MEKNLRKILKKLVSEGYKLKSHHSNTEWKEALEDAEKLIIDIHISHYNLDRLDQYYIDELVDVRRKARDAKMWDASDRIRSYLDSKSVIIMDTKNGQVVYYEKKGTTRQELIDKLEDERRAESNHEAWLYTMRQSMKSS
jgi:cysteinyl-tRNA synthetase